MRDEGLKGMLRFMWNIVRDGEARERVLMMRKVSRRYQSNLAGVMMICISDRIMIRYRYKNARILFVGINSHFGSFDRGVPFSNNKMFWYLLSDATLPQKSEIILGSGQYRER